VAVRRAGDRSPAVDAVLKKRSWKRRRKTMLQIRLRGDFGQVPFGELPAQEEAEALAKHQPSAAPAHLRSMPARKVQEKHLSLALREALDGHLQARVRGIADIYNAARPVASATPRLDHQPGAAYGELVVALVKGHQVFAGFQQRRLARIS